MRTAPPLIWLLVVATVALDAVVCSIGIGQPQLRGAGMNLLFFPLAISQVSLVAIWAGFGNRWMPWRMLTLVATILVLCQMMSVALTGGLAEAVSRFGILFLAQSIAILIPLLGFRLYGITLVAAADLDTPPKASPSRWQFSLAYLLSWTTVLSIALGTLKATVDLRLAPEYPTVWFDLAVFSVNHAALGLGGLWFMLGVGPIGARACLLACTLALVLRAGTPPNEEHYRALVVLQTVWLLASLAVVRIAGYRVVRCK